MQHTSQELQNSAAATSDQTPLSALAETLIGSEIIKLSGEIKEKIKQGNKIYNFTIGDFDPSIFPIRQRLKMKSSVLIKAIGLIILLQKVMRTCVKAYRCF